MEEQDGRIKNTDEIRIESKEGEWRRLSCNNVGNHSPSLDYEYIPSPEKLNRAFDILFEEVMKQNNNPWNREN